MNDKLKERGRGLILRRYHDIRLKELIETTKNLSQVSRFSGLDFNLLLPEYEAEVLST
jgi:hypothetical protein